MDDIEKSVESDPYLLRIRRLESSVVEIYRLFTRVAPHDMESPYWQKIQKIVKELTEDVPKPTSI